MYLFFCYLKKKKRKKSKVCYLPQLVNCNNKTNPLSRGLFHVHFLYIVILISSGVSFGIIDKETREVKLKCKHKKQNETKYKYNNNDSKSNMFYFVSMLFYSLLFFFLRS